MKQLLRILCIAAFFNFIITGCSKDDSQQCNLSTAGATAVNDVTVVYSASNSGNASISTLTYKTNSGDLTISNPPLPFSTTVNISAGNPVRISASGTANNGGLSINFQFTDGSGLVAQSDSCGSN